MRKLTEFICLLVALLLFLPACTTGNPFVDGLPCTKEENEPTAGTVKDSQSTIANESEQNEVYFATGNDYYDLYVGYSWVPGPEIYLFSKEYIDPNSIQVSANIEAEYMVNVTAQETDASLTSYEIIESDGKRNAILLSADMYDIPLYVYQTYAGMDWIELGKMYSACCELREKYEADKASYDQVISAQDHYNYVATEYITEYSELNVEDIAVFLMLKLRRI